MQSRAKHAARDRENGRPGPSPGRLALGPDSSPRRASAGGQKPSRSRTRVEGWDEHFMIVLAGALALIVAAATIYQTIAWARM